MGRILSVEIKNRNIKIIEGSKNGSSLTIYKSILLTLEPGSIDDGKIVDIDSVVRIISNSLKENNIKTKNATFIINTNATITRIMELPLLKSNSETFSMIKNELSQLMTADLEKYKIVFKRTDPTTIDGVTKCLHIIYGLPTAIYEQYLKLAEKLKLDLIAMDLASNCLDNIAAKSIKINNKSLQPNTSVAFIDVGFNNILFGVLDNGKDIFSRISSNGIRDIVHNFETVYNLNQEDALSEIFSLSLNDDALINDVAKTNILEDSINIWADEFNRYIRYYNSNNKDRQIEKIYVYGSYSKINGIDQFLEARLNVTTEAINEISNVVYKQKGGQLDFKSYLNNILSLYITKKDINFLSDEKKRHKSKFNTGIFIMAASLIAVLTVAYFGYDNYVKRSTLEKDIATMDAYLSNAENIKLSSEANDIKNKALLMINYIKEVDKLDKAIKKEDAVKTTIFKEIIAAMPIGTKITSMSIDNMTIQIESTSLVRQEVAQFEKNLKELRFIDNVFIPAIIEIKEVNSVSYSYSVVCDVKDVIVNEAE